MLSKGKLIGLALAVALMPQLARCQAAGDGTTNANKAAAAPAVSVSVGPIVATNTCLIATASDVNALKCELVAEVNKAKSELAEQNRERMDTLGEKYEAKCKEVIADVRRDFFELKDILEDARTSNANALAWFGVLSTIVGVLATVFGIVIPIVMEHKREKGYETLKGELEQRKTDYDTLKKTLEDQRKEQEQKEAERQKEYENLKKSLEDQQKAWKEAEKEYEELKNGLERQRREYEAMRNAMNDINVKNLYTAIGNFELRIAQALQNSYDHDVNGKEDLRPYEIFTGAMQAVENLTRCPLQTEKLKLAIKCLWHATISMRDTELDKVKEAIVNRVWNVTLPQVEGRIGNSRDNESGKTYFEMFEKLYATYGKPKEEAKQPNGVK